MMDEIGIKRDFSFLFFGWSTSEKEEIEGEARCFPFEVDEEGSREISVVEMEECLRLRGFDSDVADEVDVGLIDCNIR